MQGPNGSWRPIQSRCSHTFDTRCILFVYSALALRRILADSSFGRHGSATSLGHDTVVVEFGIPT